MSASQSISWSLSQESTAMESSGAGGGVLGGGGGGAGGVPGGLWPGASGVVLGARQFHQEQQQEERAVHGWQRGQKHVQYATPLARQQCGQVLLSVKNPQHPQKPWYAQPGFALHAIEPLLNSLW